MKKYFLNFLTIAALVASAALVSSCDDNDDENGDFLIAGKFASQIGTGDAVFFADYASGAKSSLKSSSNTERELVGKIEDGDIIFNLSGVLDETDNRFFLSAGSSILIFQIVGTLNANGSITNAQATVKVKSGDDWDVTTVPVTSVSSDVVSIDGNASNTQQAGFPSAWFGTWRYGDGETNLVTFTAWQAVDHMFPNEPTGFLDIVSLGNNRFEMVWEIPNIICHNIVVGDDSSGGCEIDEDHPILFVKIWVEPSGQNLLFTLFEGSISVTYAVAKAYNTATSPADSRDTQILTRP